MNRLQIEQEVRRLQYEIWTRRNLRHEFGVPSPIAMFEPRIVAEFLGLHYELRQHIPASAAANSEIEAAGILDRRRGVNAEVKVDHLRQTLLK